MKNLSHPSTILKLMLFLIIALFLCLSLAAQDLQYRDPANPDKGYWQIFTNYATQNTVIKFFDADQNLLYEETIPGQYIKLTDRNIEKINQTFDQVAERKLLLAQVKLDPLMSAGFRKLTRFDSLKKRQKEGIEGILKNKEVVNLKAHAFIQFHKVKFCLILDNPGRKRVNINLYNNMGEVVYTERITKTNYKRIFSLEGMPSGKYNLMVTTTDRKFRYTKEFEKKFTTQTLQEEHQTLPLHAKIKTD